MGIKVWSRVDATSGYLHSFDFYSGQSSGGDNKDLGGRVVMKLSKPLFAKHRDVFMDRYFTSIKLIRALESNDTYATGTCQTNRKYFPEDLKGLTLDVGQFEFRQEGTMVATAWHDKGQLAFLATSSAPRKQD